ncbi:MAG: hypothetical protein Q4B70_09610 [Lachnospiraceae bacterium]|nr:hypothetical protein [Lachnospiraceae bacterium]
MIESKVIQTVQGLLTAEYQIILGGSSIGEAQIPLNVRGGTITCRIGENSYTLKRDSSNGPRYYDILDGNGSGIGYFSRLTKDKGFLKPGYLYIKAGFHEKEYSIYEVGMGKEGTYFPCYEEAYGEERQIGQIHKPAVVKDLKEEYECFAVDDQVSELLQLFSLYTDVWEHRNTGKKAAKAAEVEYSYTLNKKLKAKYNPDFVR